MIRLYNVHKVFDGKPALRNVDLYVSRGEKISVIGSSGSGKKTLLRIINGLIQPTSGEVFICDELMTPVGRAEICKKYVATVFREQGLFPHKNVLQNITAALVHVHKYSKADAITAAYGALDFAGIRAVAEVMPHELAKSEYQRAVIARALSGGQKIILFEDPTYALETDTAAEVTAVMDKICRNPDYTVIAASNELDFAAESCDRVIYMEDSRIVEDAPSHVLLRQPSEERTAVFLKRLMRQV